MDEIFMIERGRSTHIYTPIISCSQQSLHYLLPFQPKFPQSASEIRMTMVGRRLGVAVVGSPL